MIYGVEVAGNDILIISLTGTKDNLKTEVVTPKCMLPKNDESISAVLNLEKSFCTLIQNTKPDVIVLCEGGHDSKKKRVRMEFAILSACEKCSIKYITYASSAASKLIKSGFDKKENVAFVDYYERLAIAKKYQKAFIAAWRYYG